jgi:hypothetical protein
MVSHEQLIAQEIILAVLKEEGLIPHNLELIMPTENLAAAKVPESLLSYAGVYDAGISGWWRVEFTTDSLILTPIGVRNERPQVYIYNTDGDFVSTNGDYLGVSSGSVNANGISAVTFAENKYILVRTYEDIAGLSQSALAFPFAERLEPNSVPVYVIDSWKTRNDKEYLLVSEKYTSTQYFTALAKIQADDRVPGYITGGIYRAGENGISLYGARIVDGGVALGFQSTPTMAGRDINNISIIMQNGAEYLCVNEYRCIDAARAMKLGEIDGKVVIGAETVWIDIDSASGRRLFIETLPGSHAGSWFVYDNKMNCIASSLEEKPRNTVVLPENGRLAFAGTTGTEFVLR